MSSGKGSDINPQDASDLLHKLITESATVQASFNSSCGISVAILGAVKTCPDGRLAVVGGETRAPTTPTVFFDPRLAVRRTYGDSRTLLAESPGPPGAPTFSSALCFVFPDGSRFCLFEAAL